MVAAGNIPYSSTNLARTKQLSNSSNNVITLHFDNHCGNYFDKEFSIVSKKENVAWLFCHSSQHVIVNSFLLQTFSSLVIREVCACATIAQANLQNHIVPAR